MPDVSANTGLIARKALISLLIFLIAIAKDIIVSVMHVIPERSPLNRGISFGFILPIMIVGLIFSLQTFMFYAKHRRKLDLKYVLFATPTVLCWLYGLIALVFGLYYI